LVFPEIPIWRVLAFSLGCGFVGQSGDLLMSLVKRVGQVKDSGHIMPGHGGILDRVDGIFLSAPLVYAFAIS
jgi:phosphatidate cytidylyltransferase